MTDITVSLEDLELLISGAGAIKQIEATISQQRRDPFTPPEIKFAPALDRLLREARSARRSKETYATPWDGELDAAEYKFLDDFTADSYDIYQLMSVKLVHQTPEIGRLNAKGCVILGQPCVGVLWPGADHPDLRKDPTQYAIKVTDRGHQKLQEARRKRESSNASHLERDTGPNQ